MTKKLPHLLLAIDAGASSIKIVGSLAGDAECVPLSIDPYCLEVEDIPPNNSTFNQHSVWVKIGEITYAIGNLAVAKYDCPMTIKPAKMDTAIPKVCAAIAVYHQKFNLPMKFDLSIVSVLPPGEFAWEDDFASMLMLALRKPLIYSKRIEYELYQMTEN